MSTSVFLNFIKLLKNIEQINNKIKSLPYNAYYLTAKHIGGNYRFNEDGNIYYEDVVIDCNSFLGVDVLDKSIIQTTNNKIVKACYKILRVDGVTTVKNNYWKWGDTLCIGVSSNVFSLKVNICYMCGKTSHYIHEHGNRGCNSRRCINTYGDKCSHCFVVFHYYWLNPTLNNFDCVCCKKYINQKAESYFNLEKLIRHIIALG